MTIDTGQPSAIPAARKEVSVSLETLSYVLIAIVSAAIRWISLGAAALSGAEAPQAIAAWHMLAPTSAPGAGTIDSILVYAGSVVSFAISGPSTAAARFVPAIAGAALAMSPLLFRHRLGRVSTILCMAILAVSPSTVITSRQMTGVGLAMLGVVVLLAAVDRYVTTTDKSYAVLAGIGLAVMLLADFGSLAILVMLAGGVGLAILTDEEGDLSGDTLSGIISRFPWTAALIGLGTTIILLGTLFYVAPNGLAAAADQIARFFGGLVSRPANTPYLGLVIFAYEPFLLIFGLIAAWSASQSSQVWRRFLAGWTIASIIIALAYPGALPAHSLWTVVPLASLTALLLTEMLQPLPRTPVKAIAIHAAGTVGLIAMTMGSLARQLSSPQMIPVGSSDYEIPYDIVLIVMWVILGIVMWFTIASVWGRAMAWHGLGLGTAVVGLAVSIGLSAAVSFTRPTSPFELFNQSPADPGLSILVRTAEDVSLIATHDRHDATLTILGSPNTVTAWALKDFRKAQYVSAMPASTQSVIVITPAEVNQPDLESNYVGQSFIVSRQWSIAGLDILRFLTWLMYRTDDSGVFAQERVILWVREDVYQLVPKENVAR